MDTILFTFELIDLPWPDNFGSRLTHLSTSQFISLCLVAHQVAAIPYPFAGPEKNCKLERSNRDLGQCFLEPECENKCRSLSEKQCSTVQEEQCTTVNKQQCSTVNEQKCTTVQASI